MELVRRLCADDVGRLEAFGAFEQVKLHGLTLVQGAVAVLLDGGEVHEYIFPRGALDKSIPLRPVEPLHCTFLSHGKNSFHNREELFSSFLDRYPGRLKSPSKKPVETYGCVYDVQKNYSKKEKTPQSPTAICIRCRNLRSPIIWRVSTTPNKRSTTSCSHHRTFPGIEQQIISTIKTIRKKN